MKTIFTLLFISFSAEALELKFIGPCEADFIMKTNVTEMYDNVGELTVATLTKFGIPFKGSAEGLGSVFETPVGDEAVERVTENEFRAYGWCFSVDGVSPDVYPHEATITTLTKSITWHFGFARNVRGQWITQCTPAHSVKPDFLCK